MKEYKVIYEEVILHEFPIEAENFDSLCDAFDQAAYNGELDFSDGYPSISQITKACDGEGNEQKFGDSYADLERELEDYKSRYGNAVRFNIWKISDESCRISANHILAKVREIAGGGCIHDLDTLLYEMERIKKEAKELGYEAVFEMMGR